MFVLRENVTFFCRARIGVYHLLKEMSFTEVDTVELFFCLLEFFMSVLKFHYMFCTFK